MSTQPASDAREIAADEELYRNFVEQSPQITVEQIAELDQRFMSQEDGVIRRSALHTLAQSAARLVEIMTTEDHETVMAMVEMSLRMEEYAKRLATFSEMVNSASLRIQLAMASRPDMHTLIELASSDQEALS